MSNIFYIDIKKPNVAFASVNRETQPSKNLIDGIKNLGGIVMPGLVIKSELMLELGFNLFDPNTKEKITAENVNEYPWTVVDGQTRYLSALKINADAEKQKSKQTETNADEHKSEIFTVDTMPVFEYEGSSKDINLLIITLNNTGKAWSAKDHTHNKFMAYADRPVVNVTYRLLQSNFSISSVSRIVAGVLGKITKDAIAKYDGSSNSLDDIDFSKGIALLCLLLEAGFNKTFLKNRYFWDVYNSLGQTGKGELVNYISRLADSPELYVDDITEIEKRCKNNDNQDIVEYLKKKFNDDSFVIRAEEEILKLASNSLEPNLQFIENAYKPTPKSAKKETKSKKKNKKSDSTADESASSNDNSVKNTEDSVTATASEELSDTNTSDESISDSTVNCDEVATEAEQSDSSTEHTDVDEAAYQSDNDTDELLPECNIADEQDADNDVEVNYDVADESDSPSVSDADESSSNDEADNSVVCDTLI